MLLLHLLSSVLTLAISAYPLLMASPTTTADTGAVAEPAATGSIESPLLLDGSAADFDPSSLISLPWFPDDQTGTDSAESTYENWVLQDNVQMVEKGK